MISRSDPERATPACTPAELAALRRDAERLAIILQSRSWRWTMPLRFAGRLARHGLGPDDRYRLRMLALRLRQRVGLAPPSVRLPPPPADRRPPADLIPAGAARLPPPPAPQGDRPDVLVWAVIDWHFRVQRPQHLARALADGGHRVFYLSNNFVDDPEPGFAIEPLDDAGRLYQVHLHLRGAPAIYANPPDAAQAAQLAGGLERMAHWHGGRNAVSIVQHPFWTVLTGRPPATHVVYDCMDHHAGFGDNTAHVTAEERRLIDSSDLVVVTSQWLAQDVSRHEKPVALIRNATEYSHFSARPARVFADPQGRRVIGYFGAIAHWFDPELVRAVAARWPEHLVLLVGSDTAGIAERLGDLPNVRFTGEVKYRELPYWLYGFDVCLLPFKVEPLTLATNPVKVYEYLSAGRAVVSVDLPEMVQFGDLVRIAQTPEAFVEAVGAALDEDAASEAVEARRAFARRQTWAHRADELDRALLDLRPPRVSVVVVTYNNLDYTRACLESLERFSDWSELEILVVDNASQDGTPAFLAEWARGGALRRIILNDDNRGFAAANNQGLAVASGDYLVLLNNDTYVTRGWVRGLLSHLRRDPEIGLVGPVTNNIGNEARIDTDYVDMDGMAAFAAGYTARHAGRAFDIRTLAFFCVAMPRSTYERVGPLDEAFGIGFFEDDDYCRRVEASGLRCVCAEDVFVHHHLSATFNAVHAERRQQLFERNRAIYEAKWGPWVPHVYRAAVATPEAD